MLVALSAIGFTAPIARVRPVPSHSVVVAHSTLVIRVACPRPILLSCGEARRKVAGSR